MKILEKYFAMYKEESSYTNEIWRRHSSGSLMDLCHSTQCWCSILFTLTLTLLNNGGYTHNLRHIVHLQLIPNITYRKFHTRQKLIWSKTSLSICMKFTLFVVLYISSHFFLRQCWEWNESIYIIISCLILDKLYISVHFPKGKSKVVSLLALLMAGQNTALLQLITPCYYYKSWQKKDEQNLLPDVHLARNSVMIHIWCDSFWITYTVLKNILCSGQSHERDYRMATTKFGIHNTLCTDIALLIFFSKPDNIITKQEIQCMRSYGF